MTADKPSNSHGGKPGAAQEGRKMRSRAWFDNPENADMTALYLERYLNYGFTREELQSNKPIIGIAQTGSDLSPCNRHHIVLAERLRDGIRTAGGIAIEFPVHPIQETGKRPTASLDRNLAYLGLVEVLYGYPLDGVILTMYDARLNLSRQVAGDAREYFGPKVFDAVIPRNVRLAEAPSFGKPIIVYDVGSVGAVAYLNAAKEVIHRLGTHVSAGADEQPEQV